MRNRTAGVAAGIAVVLAVAACGKGDAPGDTRATPDAAGQLHLGGALGVSTWLTKWFLDTVPRELDESATVDGVFQVLQRYIVGGPTAGAVKG